MIQWTTVEDAIHAWVVAGSGLAAGKVIWSKYQGPRPATPYIALRVSALERLGHDWHEVEDNPGGAAGEEIRHLVRGTRRLTLSLQAFGGGATGGGSPEGLLDGVIAEAQLESRRVALAEVSFGLTGWGPIQSIDGTMGTAGSTGESGLFEPRSMVEATANIGSEVTELGTYVEKVEITDTTRSEDLVVSST